MSSDSPAGTTQARRSRKRARAVSALAIAAAVLIAGCGIPQFVFIAPPVLGVAEPVERTMTFGHSEDNDLDSFLGYEVYYKFYDPAATAAFADDRLAIRNASPGIVTTVLRTRGYRRVHERDATGRRPPLIPVVGDERRQRFSVLLEFHQDPPTGAVASWSVVEPRRVELVRDPAVTLTPQVGFTPSELTPGTPPDLPGTPEPDQGRFLMGLAVLSYGIDYVTGTFSELYSTAIVPDDLLWMGYQ